MIQPLRRSHFWIWIGLSVLLPIFFVVGVLSRQTITPVNPAVHWESFK